MLTRRSVLVGLVGTAAGALVAPGWLLGGATAAADEAVDPVTALLRAYVSTLVPGPGDDPLGTAGGVEAGGVETILEQAPYVVPLLVADLTAVALATHGADFASLDYPAREALVVDAFAERARAPHHLIALALGAGAFYGDFRNHVGSTHLGVPPVSLGYLATYTDRTGHGQPEGEAVPA
jgi:hypothetical protein